MAPKNSRSKSDSHSTLDSSAKSALVTTPAASPAPAPAAAPAAATAVATKPAPAIAVAAATATPAVASPAKPAATPAARDRSTIVALIAKLSDPEADIARDAAATLATLPHDAPAVDALCDVLRNADGYFHSVVRTAAAAALGQLRDRRSVDALILATRDTMAEASEEAVKALGLLGDPKAIPTLHNIIRNESNFFLDPVRKTAVQALARLNP